VPSSQAQSALIQSTYRNAGLDFAETGYFEGHVSRLMNTNAQALDLTQDIGNGNPVGRSAGAWRSGGSGQEFQAHHSTIDWLNQVECQYGCGASNGGRKR
jgi:hypothetical protein